MPQREANQVSDNIGGLMLGLVKPDNLKNNLSYRHRPLYGHFFQHLSIFS